MKVDVLTSGLWQTSSTILSSGGDCVVVDPAYFPRELDAVAARVAELGRASRVVFTHGHWDHVMGHAAFPGVPVVVSHVLATAIAAGNVRHLEDARAYDSRWYVPRPAGHRWPAALTGLAEGDAIAVGGETLRALHLPGHCPDGLGLIAGDTLLVGDYLSPCEIPFIDDADAYRATLARLLDVLAAMSGVVPGHGPRLARAEAVAIARADLEYLDQLIDARERRDAAAARDLELPRAADVVGMREHHRENCAVVGLCSPATET